MKLKHLLINLPLLASACCMSSANAAPLMNVPTLHINVNPTLTQYIINHKGSSHGKFMDLIYKYDADYSKETQAMISTQNLNVYPFKQALLNLDNSISRLIMYNGLKNIKFMVEMDNADENVYCNADFEQSKEYKTITLNLSLTPGAGHCAMQVQTTE